MSPDRRRAPAGTDARSNQAAGKRIDQLRGYADPGDDGPDAPHAGHRRFAEDIFAPHHLPSAARHELADIPRHGFAALRDPRDGEATDR